MSSRFFEFDILRKYLMDGTVYLTQAGTIKIALINSTPVPIYSSWQVGTPYVAGNIVIPTTSNGHRYKCTVGGISHAVTEPTWPTADSGTVSDNTVGWTEYGGELANNTVWADLSSSEVATGDGYTTGGAALTSLAATYSGRVGSWDADDVTWASLTKTFRYAVIYKSGTYQTIVNPLIGYLLLDDTPADIVVSGVDYTVKWDISGIMQMGVG